MIFNALQEVCNHFAIKSWGKFRIFPLPPEYENGCGLQFTKEYHNPIDIRVPVSTIGIRVGPTDTVEDAANRLQARVEAEITISQHKGFMLYASALYIVNTPRGGNSLGGGLFVDLVPAAYDGQTVTYQVLTEQHRDSRQHPADAYDATTHTATHTLQTIKAVDVHVWDANVHREYTEGSRFKGAEIFSHLQAQLDEQYQAAQAKLETLRLGYALEADVRKLLADGRPSVAVLLLKDKLRVNVRSVIEFNEIAFYIDDAYVMVSQIHTLLSR